MILDCKFAISDGTRDLKLFALIDSSSAFNFMSSLVAIKPNKTLVAVKLANRTVVCSLGTSNGLVSSSR